MAALMAALKVSSSVVWKAAQWVYYRVALKGIWSGRE
jgi:hypothetical protein